MGPSDGISVLKICSGRYSHCVRVSALMHVPGAQREGSWHGLLSAHSLLNPRGEPLPSSSHQSPFYPLTGLGESLGKRSLVGYSPWGHKELDTTERLHFSLTAAYGSSCILESSFLAVLWQRERGKSRVAMSQRTFFSDGNAL